MKTLKISALIITLLLFFPLLACAGRTNIQFEWDPIADPDVVQVRLYQRAEAETYDYTNPMAVAPVPNNEVWQYDVTNGTWYWVARAIDNDGFESTNSNEVTETLAAPPGSIQNLIIKLKQIVQ